MKILIFFTIIFLPIIMVKLTKIKQIYRLVFNLLAIISYIVFGGIAATSIAEIIINHVVFMTTIHGIFLNMYFIISGSYLGIYVLYQLMNLTMLQFNKINT